MEPKPAQPVKLIVAMLAGGEGLLARASALLGQHYGPVDLSSPIWPFEVTDYYRPQMGSGLLRQIVSFQRLIDPAELTEIKLQCNRLERQMAADSAAGVPRPVNLDAGYVAMGKLVLATTKDRDHRIYLRAGIYAEVTLHYVGGAWRSWPWTYPDYAAPTYHEFLARVRETLRRQLRQMKGAG